MAQILGKHEDPVVFLERNVYGHPLAGLLWARPFDEVLLRFGREKVSNLECRFVQREQGLFLSVFVMTKTAGRKQNAPMWNKLMKNVDLDEPTSFLHHVYLGCIQRECKPNEIFIEDRKKFESRISAGATEKLRRWESLTQRRLRGPTTWKDMRKNAVSWMITIL